MLIAFDSVAGGNSGTAALGAFSEVVLAVVLNGQPMGDAVLLQDEKRTIYVSAGDLAKWRLRATYSAPIEFRGGAYFPISTLPRVESKIDQATQTIEITVPPELFTDNQFDFRAATSATPVRPGLGGFLNYSLLGTRGSEQKQLSGLFELGVFGQLGTWLTNYLANTGDGSSRGTRLESVWVYDMPERIATLRVGDSINRTGEWGRGLRFGGVQYATDFSTQPNLVTIPGQFVSGQAVVPSTVDVYVNNALVGREQVQPGPFTITNVPVVTGTGDVRLVVRDVFGQQQLITQPFYASPNLLKEGLVDFSYDLGFARNDFGTRSNSYAGWVGSGTYRKGLSDTLTAEVRSEADSQLANLGVSGDYLFSNFAVLSGTLAGGASDAGSGALWAAGISRQASRLSFAVRSQWTTPEFRQVAQLPGQLPAARLATVSGSYNMGRYGSFGAAYVSQNFRSEPDVRVGSLGYSVEVGWLGFFSVSVSRTSGAEDSAAINATLTIPLSGHTFSSASLNRVDRNNGGDTQELAATLQRNLPVGEGYGYRLRASDNGPQQAEVAYQNAIGTYIAEVGTYRGDTAVRVGATGGIGLVGGTPFLSRTITDSFGLVTLPGYPDVRVYAENQEIGRTNAQGDLIIPRLRPYQENRIRIEQLDIPLDAEVGTLGLTAVPFYRSGLVIPFPVKPARSGLIQIILDDGQPIPPGAVVEVKGRTEQFPVAFDGEAYLTGLDASNQVRVIWRDQSCEIDVPFPETKQVLPRLGRFACHGVNR